VTVADGPDKGEGEEEQEAVPRLPRGRLLPRMAMIDLIRIGMIASLLVVVIMLRKPCADGMANLIDMFSDPDAGPPPAHELELRRLTDEEIREAFGGDVEVDLDLDAGPAGAPEPVAE
jgi:hypothetical protein